MHVPLSVIFKEVWIPGVHAIMIGSVLMTLKN